MLRKSFVRKSVRTQLPTHCAYSRTLFNTQSIIGIDRSLHDNPLLVCGIPKCNLVKRLFFGLQIVLSMSWGLKAFQYQASQWALVMTLQSEHVHRNGVWKVVWLNLGKVLWKVGWVTYAGQPSAECLAIPSRTSTRCGWPPRLMAWRLSVCSHWRQEDRSPGPVAVPDNTYII